MATGSVSFQSTLINPANYYVAALYDTSNLSTVIESIAPTKGAGYSNPFMVTFATSLNPSKLYRVILWENTTAVVGGTSRVSCDFKASVNVTTVRADEILVYGIDSQYTNTTTIVDASIIGWGISFEQFGTGTLTPGTDYTYNSSTGTIVLINGTSYVSGQKMVIHFQPQITPATPVYSGISTGRTIAVNTTLTYTDSNSAIYLKGSGGSFVVTLPALSAMADYQPIEFFSFGGNHVNVTLLCQGSDNIQWNILRTNLILGQSESLTMFKANGVWNVKHPSFGINAAGELVLNYSKAEINTVLANGALLSRTTYPRLWAFVQGLEASCITTEASWSNTSTVNGIVYNVNKGLYTSGDGSTTFRVPLLYNYGSMKLVDGSARYPGSLQTGQVGAFTSNMNIPIGDSFLGTGPSSRFGRGAANPSTPAISNSFNAGLENYPTNTGIYGLIRI